jgi:hypothetical protein
MKAKDKSALQVHQMTIAQLEEMFPDEVASRSYLQAKRWPEVVQCDA